VVGLDGAGGAARYASVGQWLAAYEAAAAARVEAAKPAPRPAPPPPKPRAKKLSFNEARELEGMEAAIMAAEDAVKANEARVQEAAGAGHVALGEACRAMEAAQAEVERLYARWQDLEAKKG
jgi:ATP-binding cassette subfamily F protein uup